MPTETKSCEACGQEIGANEPDAVLDIQIACGASGARYQTRIGFYSDRPGEQACGTGSNPISASEIYKEAKLRQVYSFEEIEQVLGP